MMTQSVYNVFVPNGMPIITEHQSNWVTTTVTAGMPRPQNLAGFIGGSIDVRDFGLKSNEEVPGFDNSAALTSALTSVLATGEALLFPANMTFLFGSRVVLPSVVNIIGSGRSSILKLINGVNDYMLVAFSQTQISIENLTLDGNKDNQTAGGTNLFQDTTSIWLHNVWSINSYNNGFLFDQDCWEIRFGHLYVEGCGAPSVGASGGHGIAFSGDNHNGTGKRCKNIQGNQVYVKNPHGSGVNFSECENAYIDTVICIHDGTGGAHDSGYGGVRFTNGVTNGIVRSVYSEGMSRGVFIAEGRNIQVLSGRAHLSGKQGVFVSEDDIQNIDCAVINFVVTEPCQLVAVGEQQGVYVRKATRFNLDVYVESTDGKMVSGIIEHSDCVDSNISLRTNSVGATTTDISLAFATTGGLLRASKRIGTDFSGLQLVGGSLAGGPTMQPFSLPGAGSDIPLQLFASGNGTVRMGNANGISLRAGSGIATQVNYALVQGAAASNGPVYTAAGTDTNIGVTLRPVGTGEARILSGDGTLMLRAANGGLLSFRGVGTVVAPTLSAALPTDGSATNVAIATAINAIRTALIDQGLCV